jgi:tetratricopeptide (TPR) repeat protein
MEMIEPFGAKRLFVLLRFAKWDEVLRLPAPDSKWHILTALFHFGRAVARAALGHAAEAEQERLAYEAARNAIPPDSAWGFNKARNVIAVMDAVLEARLAAAQQQLDAAIGAWQRAVEAEDALSYNEPPDWFYPTRESLGGALLAARRADDAAAVFRTDLERNPRNGRSLFGLWQALLAQGRSADAARVEREFRQAWSHADVKLKLSDF